MKTVFFLMTILFLGVNFASCTPEAITEQVEELATEGEDGELGGEDKGGGDAN